LSQTEGTLPSHFVSPGLHSTQCPWPSQLPPFPAGPHAVPAASGVVPHAPVATSHKASAQSLADATQSSFFRHSTHAEAFGSGAQKGVGAPHG
jgi:hypothetical protein